MKNLYSISSFLFVIAATLVAPFTSLSQCDYTFEMTDSWGDGWNGASITVTVNGNPTNVTCSGASTTSTVATEDGAVVTFDWNSGSYDSECGVTITAPDGSGIYQGGSFSTQITDVSNAPGCEPPPLCAQSGVEADGIVVDIAMSDSYNDGWDGASISVCIDGNNDYTSSFTSGASDSHSFTLTEGQVYNISYAQGSYESEHSYTVTVDGVQVYSSGTSPSPGVQNYGSYCNSAAAISGTLAACESSTSQLTFSGASGGVWSSSDAGVASVSGSGLVTANAAGSATITYTSANGSADCDASYSVTFNTLSAPSSGTISGTSDIAFGSTSQLSTSGDAGGTWSSDNTSVATVDASTGLVTSVSAGSATITYTISAAGCTTSSSTYSVNVVNPSPDTCFDLASLPVNFINGDNGTLSWVSGNQSTPSSSTGPTTGFGGTPGMFYVEASGIYNTAHDLSMMVGISSASSPVVSFDYSMYGAAMGTLEVLVDGTSIWSLSGDQGTEWQSAVVAIDISTISDLNNVKITFRGTTGSAYTSDFALDNICILDCSQVGSISGTLSVCDPGETSQLSQDGASGGVWSSDNTAIATVNSSGLVTAVAQGSANISYTIAASGSCPESSVSSAFVVVGVPDGGTITGTTSLDIGQSSTLTSDGSSGGSWTSDDQTVATVDASSGNVTAVGPGTATITYTVSGDGCSSASSNVGITVSSDIIAPTSGSIDVTICSGNLYDDGGASGNYSNSSSQVVTLYPSTAGSFINVAGSFDSETNWDGATFYDGTNTSAAVLGTATGTGVTIDFTATNVDGAITISFTSDGSVNDAGFALAISCLSSCSGTPATATAVMTQSDFCTGTSGSLSASGIESGSSGLSYYWEQSTDDGTTWTDIGYGQFTNDELSTTVDDIQFRYVTTCANSGLSSTSNAIIKKFADITAGADATVCPNESVSLTATQAYSSEFDVEWYAASSGGTALATGSPYSPSPSVTTTYYAASSGCPDTRVAVIANISELTSSYGDASTCTGVDATLTGTYTGNGVTFSWSPTTGLDDPTAAIPTSSASTGLTYTLTLTDNLSCSITDDVVLTITESTAGTLSATSTTFAVAETSTVSTDGTTGGTFATSDASVATVDASTGVVTGVSAGTVTITYTTPECSGQTYSNTIDLTIACDAGTVSLTSSSVNIGGTSTASSSGTAGGSWSSDNTAVASVDASTGVVTGVTAGAANITYTTSTACGGQTSSAAITITCASDLVVTYDDVEHCSGNSSTISGTVSDPDESYTYTFSGYDSYGDSWNGNAVDIIVDGVTVVSGFANQGAAAGVAETVTFSAGASSVITLSWTPGSYQGEVSWDIKIPGLFVLSSGDYGDTDGGTTSYSTATYTYSWSPSTDLDDATIASPTASNTTTETYTVTITNSTGCTGTDDVIATVSNPTAGTLSGTTTIAPEGTTTISSDGTSGGVWESDDTAVATVDASTGIVTGGIAGSATITYSVGGTACPDASTITVNVVCDAYTVVYDDVTFCDGTPTTLSQTSNSQNSTYEFYGVDSWGDGWNGASVDISVNGVTVLTGVEVTASTVSAYFDAPAGATIGFDWTSGSYNSEISWGLYDASVNLLDDGAYGVASSTIPGSAPTYTYSWSPSTGLDDASIMEPTSSASSTTVYTVTVTDGFGCVATDDVTATVNPLYTPSVSIVSSDADNEICSGDAVTFTATAVDAGNPTYVWNIGGSPVSGETASTFTTTTLVNADEVTVTVTADNTCQTVNEVTSTGITTTVNAVTAGTIEAAVDGGTTYASSQQVIQAGNDIYWNYTAGSATGTFSNFEYQWGGTTGAYADNWGATTNPWNWGAGQSGVNPNQTIYVRAKVSCGSNLAYSDPVAVDWLTCYGGTTEIATSTSDGGSIVDGGNMTVNSTISWTAPTDAFGDAYHWEYSWNGGSSFNGEWQNNTNPATWSDNIGSQADNTLTIRYVATGAGSCSDNSVSDFDVTILRPVITVSAMSGDLAVCSDGDASPSETFTVEGLYIANDDNAPAASASHTGILVSAPAGLEISTDNSTFSSTINLSATNGTVSQTTIYARIIAGQSASNVSGDIVCTAQAATTQNVSAVATIDENAEIETSVSFTGTTTCGEVSIDVQVNGVSAGSGAWTALSGLFLSATDVATTYTTSTFGSTITLTWTSSNGACAGETTSMDVEFNQPTTSTIDGYGMDTECWIWGGLTDDDWSEPSNWYAYTTDLNNNSYWERQTVNIPAATDKVYIMSNSDAGQCVSSSNSAIATPGAAVTDLMVANGATLNLSGATSIKGDLTNDGTINAGSSTLTFDGTSDQTVSGNALTLDNLTVNKTSGNLIMSTPVNVNGLLELSSDVNNGSNVLSVGTSSASLGSIDQNGGIVLGKLRRYFANAAGSKSFPVGIAGTMRDVAVDFVSAPGTDQYITASYNTGSPQANDGTDLYEGLPLTTSDNQLIQNYDDEGYWEIIPGSSSTGDSYIAPINGKQYNVTLHCNNLTGADNVTNMDRTKVRIIKSAGPGHTSWEALTHVSTSGDDADFLLTASGTGFSFFGAGTEDDNALPVELISFSGDCNDGVVDLIWQTASEQNSEDFEIEYSRDGVDWSLVHTEPAAGFSNELITYNFSHKQAISGNNYYRLTQNDIDGTATIYNNLIINASCQSTSNGYFSVFPNPSSGNFQVIMNNPEIEGAAQLRIVDTKGNEVFMKSIEVNSGINMFVIQQDLAPGIYYINIENNSRTTNVVKHSIR